MLDRRGIVAHRFGGVSQGDFFVGGIFLDYIEPMAGYLNGLG